MNLKKLSIFFILFVVLPSCGRQSNYSETLRDIDSIIESRPDSARGVLESMDTDGMSRKNRAKHALLLSMALDKTYEDRVDFNVLQPAIDYYGKHGKATDKLRALYYQGKLLLNAGDDAAAMECFYEALNFGQDSPDVLTKARLLAMQGNIYYSRTEFEQACNVYLQAAKYFYNNEYTESYVSCLLKAAKGFTQEYHYDKAREQLDAVRKCLPNVTMEMAGAYYATALIWQVETESSDAELRQTLCDYERDVSAPALDYNTLAVAYGYIGEYDKALESLSKVPAVDENDIKRRNAVAIDIYESMGRYKDALECYRKFNEMNDSLIYAVYNQNICVMEERHNLELAVQEEHVSKARIIFGAILALLLMLIVVVYYRYRLNIRHMRQTIAEQELEHYKMQAEQLAEEHDNLTELLAAANGAMDKEVVSAINKRLGLLNHFLAAYITSDNKLTVKADKEILDLLEDKESFVSSTRLTFLGSHPHFIKHLEECGLTDREVELCCLYALGLNGKSIGVYFDEHNLYKISSNIRKKLGMDAHSTNLCLHVRKLLKS